MGTFGLLRMGGELGCGSGFTTDFTGRNGGAYNWIDGDLFLLLCFFFRTIWELAIGEGKNGIMIAEVILLMGQ